MSVVLIRNATEDDIEDLFARLNSGEPLTAADRRNATGADMAALIRDVARRPFFAAGAGSPGARDHRLELAARILSIEHADPDGRGKLPDLRNRALDAFVESNRRLAPGARSALLAQVDAGLRLLERVLGPDRPPLAHHGRMPLHYLFVRLVARQEPEAVAGLRGFLERFERARATDLRRPPARRDPGLAEYGQLAAHGRSERRNVDRRLEILRAALRAERGVAE